MKHTILTQTGSTLIELLLYIAIATGIIIGVGAIGAGVMTDRAKAQTLDEMRYRVNDFASILSTDIREGSRITVPQFFDTASTTLTIGSTLPSRNPTVYQFVAGILYRTVGTGTPVVVVPAELAWSGASFSLLGATGTTPSVRFTGQLTSGSGTIGTGYRLSIPVSVSASLRAPQP